MELPYDQLTDTKLIFVADPTQENRRANRIYFEKTDQEYNGIPFMVLGRGDMMRKKVGITFYHINEYWSVNSMLMPNQYPP